MRALLTFVLLTFSLASFADTYEELYETAGWTEQRANFSDALTAAQQRYKDTLPPAVFQTLVTNSNRRFASHAIDQRVQQALREHLAEPQPALEFFQSTLGRKIVSAEVLAARRDHLAQALPASEAGAEVSLALAGVAADSLSQMIPGLLGGNQAQSLLSSQRQRMIEQIEGDLDNTLLYVYRDLSDAELEQYLEFARSDDGKAYYQAALQALRAGLAVGMSGTELEPQQGI
ncbi:MAG: hypothetical protein ACLGIW_02080 [Gammaproteobacteria bacterium]